MATTIRDFELKQCGTKAGTKQLHPLKRSSARSWLSISCSLTSRKSLSFGFNARTTCVTQRADVAAIRIAPECSNPRHRSESQSHKDP